ncbi:MAG: NAD(P)H-dependent oxidoreductase [Reyranellaceae bacterium]
MSRILIVQGHPDPAGKHFCQALAQAYAEGAAEGGHETRSIEVSRLDFPLMRSMAEFEKGEAPPDIKSAQESVLWAEHLVVIFPLWLGSMPALLKGFFEQSLRPGFAFEYRERGFPLQKLKGRSARIVVTMGMPGLMYRWWYGAHGVKSLRRNILGFVGIGPIRDTLFGMIDARRAPRMLAAMRALGRKAG